MQAPKLEPLIFVIFGASGDLAKRKLIPAVFDLFKRNYLPDNFALLGISRTELSDDAFREQLFRKNEFIELDGETAETRNAFAQRLAYQAIDTNDPADYGKIKDRLASLDTQFKTGGNCIFYLSTPPVLYDKIPAFLAEHGLNHQDGSYRRLVIEKPFGYDLDTARKLNASLKQHFDVEYLPHRSLPGQRDGAKSAGDAVCQRNF